MDYNRKIKIVNQLIEVNEVKFTCNASNVLELTKRVENLEKFIQDHLAYMPNSKNYLLAKEDFEKLLKK